MDTILRTKRQAKSRYVLSAKEMRVKRDEARVRNEARAVLGLQSRWLDVPNLLFGGKSPMDVVRDGHLDLVLNTLNAIKYGQFS